MGLVLEANYSKKLGLPGYSSHQYSVTVRTELTDISKVAEESKRLYSLLQGCVDRELEQTGYLPGNPASSQSHSKPSGFLRPTFVEPTSSAWRCTPKQQERIRKIMEDQQLTTQEIEDLAEQMFGTSLPLLTKVQASSLINQLSSYKPHPVTFQSVPQQNGRQQMGKEK